MRADARGGPGSSARGVPTCCGAQVLRQVAGVPVQQVPGRRSGARAGDALDRRGDGRRRELRRGVREGAVERRHAAARARVRSSSASTTATSRKPSRSRKRFAEFGFQFAATRGTAAAAQSGRHPGQDGLQGERRPAQRGRSAEGRARCNWSSTPPPAPTRSATRRSSAGPRSPIASPASRPSAPPKRPPKRSRRATAIPIRVWSLQEIHAGKTLASA